MWSIESSEFRHSFPHSSDVLSVDFSPDANLLLTGCLSGTVKVIRKNQQYICYSYVHTYILYIATIILKTIVVVSVDLKNIIFLTVQLLLLLLILS